jgi:hypothetical protein
MIRHPMAAGVVVLGMTLTACGGDSPTEAGNPVACIHRQLDRFEEAHVELNFSLLNEVFDGSVAFVDLFRDEARTYSRSEFLERWRANYSEAVTVHRYVLVGRGIDMRANEAVAEAAVSWEITWREVGRQTGGFAILFGFALQGNTCPVHALLVG